MSKLILVIDTPENCYECPLLNSSDECSVQGEDANFNSDCEDDLIAGCPLIKLPDKKQICGRYPQPDRIPASYKAGYNACIDEILKEDINANSAN